MSDRKGYWYNISDKLIVSKMPLIGRNVNIILVIEQNGFIIFERVLNSWSVICG